MSNKYATTPPLTDRMPGGIPFIVGNEAAERFSFYGMKTILFVFMTDYLVNQSGELAPLNADVAKEYVHYFVSAAYFFPIIGALLSDAILGKYRTIMFLSIVYCLGHFALALDETRLGLMLGLTLIAIGSGGIKPCVSAHVGDQFGEKNKHLMTRVFQWFYFSINLGAFASTLLTPFLLAKLGPGVAFGVPGFLMALATLVFWLGRHRFVHIPASGTATIREAFSGPGLRALANLSLIFLCVSMFWALFDQTASAWIDQARQMDLHWAGVTWYPSQVQAANPLMIMAFIPLFSYLIYPWVSRVFPLTPLRKIAIGFFVCTIAFGVSAWIESRITGGEIVQFKHEADGATLATSEVDKDRWPAGNLLDGRVDGSGWAAQFAGNEDDQLTPLETVIRLREKRPWPIQAVEVDTHADVIPLLTRLEQRRRDEPTGKRTWTSFFTRVRALFEAPPLLAISGTAVAHCRPTDIEVLVSDARIGPWNSVGRTTIDGEETVARIDFAQVTAEYVMLRIHPSAADQQRHFDREGEPILKALGEIEVIASGSVATDAHEHASKVWPNVAATGHRPSIAWQLLAYALLTAAEIMISITCLEFAYTQAPPSIKSIVMSVYLLSVSLGNFYTARVNNFIQNDDGSSKLEGANYYWFFTASIFVTALLFLLVTKIYRGKTYIQGEKNE